MVCVCVCGQECLKMVAPFEGVPGVVAKISDSEYGHQPYLLRAILV